MNRTYIAANPGKEADKAGESMLMKALDRILSGEPVQYVTGEAWFCGHKFSIRPGALIPRPETEELVISLIQANSKENPKILDIGTGSGCIAISLKKAIPSSGITAIDISEEALNIAGKNAAQLGCEIDLLKIDFLNDDAGKTLGRFDFIISNPPYIPLHERQSLDEHVREHEPAIALFVPDERPTIFYEKIADFARGHLFEKGMIFLEIHEPFADEIRELLKRRGFDAVAMKDIYGKTRMIRATLFL